MTEEPSFKLSDDRKGAVFGSDRVTGSERKYRYRLWRRWDSAKPTLAFIMLNPSTADETTDDPTVRRCIGYAREWGYGTLLVGNIFGVRETDPANLYDYFDPVGPENDDHLKEIVADAEKTIVAWGANGRLGNRGRRVAELLDADLHALDTTKAGHPAHPLYQPADIEAEPWSVDELVTDG
jgi:hypothetical protein